MLLSLTLPESAGQLSGAVGPAAADAHALVQLDTHLREGALPDIVLLELLLDAGAERLGEHLEEVLHSGLGVGWVDLWVAPDAIEAVLSIVDQGADLTKI